MHLIVMMSSGRSPQLLFIILVLLSLFSIQNVFGFNSGVEEDGNIIRCIKSERHALLMFKQGLIDDYGYLSSWGDDEDKKECCRWRGVSCSNRTGHVIKLNLQFSFDFPPKYLRGNLSSSLLELQQLNYLDLSSNDFGGQPIPKFFGSLNKLRHLNLSHSGFGGRVPYQLRNISRLRSLDLSNNYNYDVMYAGKLEWLSHLSVLRHISLNYVNLTEAVDWLQVISELTSLTKLQLRGCNLPLVTSSSSIPFVNSSKSLALLDLSQNDLSNSTYLHLSNFSSSIVHLDLSSSHLEGPIPQYVFSNMTFLRYLDLSGNNLQGPIPLYVFSNMTFLHHLDLSGDNLQGPIPKYVFSNMTFLRYLDLSSNNLQGLIPQYVFSNMTFLRHLDLSDNNLQGPISQYAFSNMTFLHHLDLSSNNIQGPIPKYAFSNTASLRHIDLHKNQIDGIDAEAFTYIYSLKTLDLESNSLTVQLSDLFFNLSDCTKRALESLTLDDNMLCGSLPDFTEFISLKELDISYNQLNAITPASIGQPLKLELLDISSNSLEGTITEVHMSNLPKLKFLYLSSNLLLTLNFSSRWVPSFQLQTIRLRACKQGPHFPQWLQTQKNFSELDISNNSISDTIPTWFWDLSPNLYYLNLSYNHMKGMLPDLSLKFVEYPAIDLSSNDFAGPIPLVPSNVTSLHLSKNKFSGSISFLCSVRGETFHYLDLSNNLLSGELPNCLWPFENLHVLHLANNNFSGKFPDLMGSTCSLQSLNLRNNNFIGELPRSLDMCNWLLIFDVGDNNFSGTIPIWIGDSFPYLIILALRSNRFNGSIPLQLCQLSNIQLVDFSLNNISGTIPKCLNNLTAMVQKLSLDSSVSITYTSFSNSLSNIPYGAEFEESAIIMWKGVDRQYKENLGYLKCIDLSSNKLSGEIPVEISTLEGLRSLNLSRNSLTGPITPEIGSLNLLDSLDLSNNQLNGEIPPSFSSLNFLGMLNLSNNNLSGTIPLGTQLQSFDANSYMGNPQLCGSPLPNKCQEGETPAIITHYDSNKDVIVTLEFYICVAIGFIVGFWGVVGSLILNRSWRHAYFQFLNQTKDRLYVAMVLNIAKLQRRPTNYDC